MASQVFDEKMIKKIRQLKLFLARSLRFGLFKKTPKNVFEKIYQTNYWAGEDSVSGQGSDIQQTKVVVKELSKLLVDLEVVNFLDVPCGDFFWMQQVHLQGISYLGGDIVPAMVEQNKQQYRTVKNVDFQVINLIEDPLPPSDLLLVRDCLVHLPFKDIEACLKNIMDGNIEYLLTTTFTNRTKNYDIPIGEWRPLNLEKPPFNFPPPILLINEGCTQGQGAFEDKALGLWRIKDLLFIN